LFGYSPFGTYGLPAAVGTAQQQINQTQQTQQIPFQQANMQTPFGTIFPQQQQQQQQTQQTQTNIQQQQLPQSLFGVNLNATTANNPIGQTPQQQQQQQQIVN